MSNEQGKWCQKLSDLMENGITIYLDNRFIMLADHTGIYKVHVDDWHIGKLQGCYTSVDEALNNENALNEKALSATPISDFTRGEFEIFVVNAFVKSEAYKMVSKYAISAISKDLISKISIIYNNYMLDVCPMSFKITAYINKYVKTLPSKMRSLDKYDAEYFYVTLENNLSYRSKCKILEKHIYYYIYWLLHKKYRDKNIF